MVGEALIGLRENVFLVSKVYPWNAGGQKAINACEASLRVSILIISISTYYTGLAVSPRRDCRSDGKLIAQWKIRRWGVSTLIMPICRNSGSCRGNQCATNQVLYHLGSRGIEYDHFPVPETADAGDGFTVH